MNDQRHDSSDCAPRHVHHQSAQNALSYFSTPPGAAVADRKRYPMFGIEYPGINDVMCGRGGASNGHIGNVRFRTLINEHKVQYLSASKQDKPKISVEIAGVWRSLNPPGRFLTKTNPKSEDSLWHDIGDKKAKEKVSQCLRERTPEIMPYVQQQQQKQQHGNSKQREIAKEKPNPQMNQPVKKRAIKPDPEVSSPSVAMQHFTPDIARSAPKSSAYLSQRLDNGVDRRSRAEVADSVPTAAELMEQVFSDEDDPDKHVMPDQPLSSMEDYFNQVQTFLNSTPKREDNDAYSTAERSQFLDTMSACSWARTVKSVDASNGGGTMLMSIISGLMDEEETSRPIMPQRMQITTRSQKMNFGKSKVGTIAGASNTSNMSELTDLSSFRDTSMRSSKMGNAKANNVSLMSDMTDFSSFRDNNKSVRSNKMGAGRNNSNYSLSSDLTDISEGLQDISVSGL